MGLLGLPGLRSEDRMLLRARRRISLSLYIYISTLGHFAGWYTGLRLSVLNSWRCVTCAKSLGFSLVCRMTST